MRPVPSPEEIASALANGYDAFFGGGLADLRPMGSSIIDEGPNRAVHRYAPRPHVEERGEPVLLVPPLAAPAFCFDLRRGCSMVEHLLGAGRRVYLVDYGDIAFSDRGLGLEHWVDEVVPRSIEVARADAGADRVHVVGWCLGGILALLSIADVQPKVRSLTMIASPFDFRQVPLIAPVRPLADLTGGRIVSLAYRAMGGAPKQLVKRAYQLAAFDKYVTKPVAVFQHIEDRDFLAQIEAVDRFTANMLAYPGRSFGQLYHRFFLTNDLANGSIELGGRTIELDRATLPVLSIAGTDDGIAPMAAVHRIADLVGDARVESAPGGHLGVLTGRGARRTTWPMVDDWLAEHDPTETRPRAGAEAVVAPR